MLMNDLVTRQHVDTMLIEADAREEYHNWLDTQADDSLDDIDIEINNLIARQTAIATMQDKTVEQYREELNDRRDSLMMEIYALRAQKGLTTG